MINVTVRRAACGTLVRRAACGVRDTPHLTINKKIEGCVAGANKYANTHEW